MDTIRSFIPGKGWTESAADSAVHPNPITASVPTNDPAVFPNEAEMKQMAQPGALNNDIRRQMTRIYTSFKTGL